VRLAHRRSRAFPLVLSSLADARLEPFLATFASPFDFPSSLCAHLEPDASIYVCRRVLRWLSWSIQL
jgi:hypothetical protein